MVDPDNEASFRECVIRSDPKQICIPQRTILKELQHHGFRKEAVFGVQLALEEALCNAVKHGNRCDPAKRVTVRFAVSDEKAVIIIRDEGGGFEPDTVPDPTAPERLRLPNGRGIMLMRAYMDEVCYRDDGREVCFVKRRE
jgi:serine/threonine-protein kinase RsbW